VTYRYDAAGQRASMTAGGVTTYYVGGRYEKNRTTAPQPVTEYYTLGPATIMRKWSSGSTFTDSYLFGDQLHSASLVTNKTLDVVQGRQHHWPYGSHAGSWGSLTDKDFTGQRLDAATATLDYGARRYDPWLGRFLSPDSIVPDPTNPQSLNRYAYSYNNPLKYIDPSGHCPVCVVIAALLVAGYETFAAPDTSYAPPLNTNVAQLPPSEIPLESHVANMAVNSVFAYVGVTETRATWDLFRLQQAAATQQQLEQEAMPRGASTQGAGAAVGARGPALSSELPNHGWGNRDTLARHFRDHGADFGAQSAEEYATKASEFLQRAQAEGLPTKVSADGTVRVFDPKTGNFRSHNPDGTTKTFFKPTSPTYWDRQPGTPPYAPEETCP
jgi:RHS repeat-associated protein